MMLLAETALNSYAVHAGKVETDDERLILKAEKRQPRYETSSTNYDDLNHKRSMGANILN